MYTEKDIQKWFEIMKNKYRNSKTFDNLKSIELMMFDNICETNNLKNIIGKNKKGD